MQANEAAKVDGDFSALVSLEKGQKYTLLVPSEFGIGATSMQITLAETKVSSYAQYSESVQLIFRLKGKRTLRGIRFHGSKSCAMWRGWLNINTNAFCAPTLSSGGLVCQQSRYLSFDSRYMTDAIASTPVPPVFSKIG